MLTLRMTARAILLTRESVGDFFGTKGCLRVFDGFFSKQKDFAKGLRGAVLFGSEILLEWLYAVQAFLLESK